MKAQDEVKEEYPEEQLNIRVTVTHDEDSNSAEELKKENEELREQLREMENGEVIPFLDYVEEKRQSEKEVANRVKNNETNQANEVKKEE